MKTISWNTDGGAGRVETAVRPTDRSGADDACKAPSDEKEDESRLVAVADAARLSWSNEPDAAETARRAAVKKIIGRANAAILAAARRGSRIAEVNTWLNDYDSADYKFFIEPDVLNALRRAGYKTSEGSWTIYVYW